MFDVDVTHGQALIAGKGLAFGLDTSIATNQLMTTHHHIHAGFGPITARIDIATHQRGRLHADQVSSVAGFGDQFGGCRGIGDNHGTVVDQRATRRLIDPQIFTDFDTDQYAGHRKQ